MLRGLRWGALSALAVACAPFAVQAQMVALPHGLYAGIDAGVIIPQSLSIKGTGTSGAETGSINGNINFDTGPATGLTIGLHLNPALAVEGNFEYANIGIRSITGTATLAGPVAGSGPFNLGANGEINAYNVLFNAIWTPLPATWYGLSPYLGAGLGFSNLNETLTSISAGGATATLNASSSETDFAANGIVGVDYALSPQLSVGARYRLLFINTASNSGGAGFAAANGNFIGHVLTANATWHF